MTGPQVPVGAPVAGSSGEPLGVVGAIYHDQATGRLAWATVRSGPRTAVVPLQVARFDGAVLHVPYGADRLASAPHHDPDTVISYADGDELALHYGLVAPEPVDPPAPVNPAPDPVTVTRSAEQLRTGVVNVVVGRARLETYVVTEDQTFTVPVRRQEVRLVYDPVPEHEQVVSDAGPSEAVHEVVRFVEQVQVTTRIVPVERVRMVRHVVAGRREIVEQVRTEQVDIERDEEIER